MAGLYGMRLFTAIPAYKVFGTLINLNNGLSLFLIRVQPGFLWSK